MVLALALLPAALAACGCEGGCWTRFENRTDATVSVVRVASDGRETPIDGAVKPGSEMQVTWDDGFLADCKDGAWIARSVPDGREVARRDRPGESGECPMFWEIGQSPQSTSPSSPTPGSTVR